MTNYHVCYMAQALHEQAWHDTIIAADRPIRTVEDLDDLRAHLRELAGAAAQSGLVIVSLTPLPTNV